MTEAAMEHLGNAIHTMQDATSPSHRGFQLWDDNGKFTDHLKHHAAEVTLVEGSADHQALSAATRKAWDLFNQPGPLPEIILDKP
jgi:hypothetical protein